MKQSVIIIVSMIILMVLFQFVPYSKDENNKDNMIDENVSRLTGEDRKFQNWTNSLSIQNDLYCITEAAKRKNLTDTEICGRILKENSNRSLMQLSGFNTSQSFEMTVSEYKKSLELYYLGGKHLEIGAKNSDIELMIKASEHIDEGKKKMTDAHYLLELVS